MTCPIHGVVTDQQEGHVLHVAEDRKTSSLTSYDDTLTDGQKAGLESIAMDMWSAPHQRHAGADSRGRKQDRL